MTLAAKSILEEIKNCSGFHTALLSTYTFDPEFFESSIIHILLNQRIRRISVFADGKMLTEGLATGTSYGLGRRYSICPVSIHGSFHPKMILLLGKDKAKLFVGSANLTTSGYLINNEVFNCFEYTEENTEYAGIVMTAVEVFKQFYELSDADDKYTKLTLNSFNIPAEPNDRILLAHNLSESIASQIKALVSEETVKQISIAVPFYDESLSAIRDLKESLNCENIHLYVQQAKSTFPIAFNETHHVISEQMIHPFAKILSNNSSNYYHGKVIELITDNNSYILYGSANCTSSAMNRTYLEKGNIECDIFVKGKQSDNHPFFETFQLEDGIKLVSTAFGESEQINKNYSFRDGSTTKENIVLRICCKEPYDDLTILYHGNKLEYEAEGNYINAIVPRTMLSEDDALITVDIIYGDKTEHLICWYNDIGELERFRNYVSMAVDFSVLGGSNENDKYDEIVTEIIRQFLENEEFNNFCKKTKRYSMHQKEENEETESGDYTILDDIETMSYEERYRYTSTVNAHRVLAQRFFSGLPVFRKGTGSTAIVSGKREEQTEEEKPERSATSTERRVAAIFKKLIRYTLSLDPDEFSYEYYEDRYGFFNEAIKHYMEENKIVDFLQDNYIYDMNLKFLDIMCEKIKKNRELEANIEWVTYETLKNLILRGSKRHGESDESDKKIIHKINSIRPFRDSIFPILKTLELDNIVPTISKGSLNINPVIFIDSLFDYKSRGQLKEYFNQCFIGSNVSIKVDNQIFELNAEYPESRTTPPDLANRYIKEILKHCAEYRYHLTKIMMRFKYGKNKVVIYEIIPNGMEAGVVNKHFIHTDKTFKCKLVGKKWEQQNFSIK